MKSLNGRSVDFITMALLQPLEDLDRRIERLFNGGVRQIFQPIGDLRPASGDIHAVVSFLPEDHKVTNAVVDHARKLLLHAAEIPTSEVLFRYDENTHNWLWHAMITAAYSHTSELLEPFKALAYHLLEQPVYQGLRKKEAQIMFDTPAMFTGAFSKNYPDDVLAFVTMVGQP